ncbi:MAG: hypothetical protein IH945_03510 [Armatimonadetes bacterium]|nr:hypothetical protein [Armatimonadota bacterium]
MSDTGLPRLELQDAIDVAAQVAELYDGTCEMIKPAGSVRRRMLRVGDIELLMMPKFGPVEWNMFEEPTKTGNLQKMRTDELIKSGTLEPRLAGEKQLRALGEKYQRLLYNGSPIDVFCVTPPAQWGFQMAVRTGPRDLSRWYFTPRCYGGAMPPGKIADAGSLWIGEKKDKKIVHKGDQLKTPTEEDFFAALYIDWVPPTERDNYLERLRSQGWK